MLKSYFIFEIIMWSRSMIAILITRCHVLLCIIVLLWAAMNRNNNASTSSPLGSGSMFDGIAPYYDMCNRYMSLGFDHQWRIELTNRIRMDNLNTEPILDVATGTADVAILIADRMKSHHHMQGTLITALDPSEVMLRYGQIKINDRNLTDMITLVHGDSTDMSSLFPDSAFQYITMSFGIRNVIEKSKALKEMNRLLSKSIDSRILILEFATPVNIDTYLAPFAVTFLKYILPCIGAIGSGKYNEYKHLSDSIMNFPSPDKFIILMEEAGFANCSRSNIFFDIVQLYECSNSHVNVVNDL